MERYKIIEENCVCGHVLDTQENEIVCLVSTKRPDLRFDKLKTLSEKANKVTSYEDTGLEPEDVLTATELVDIYTNIELVRKYINTGMTPEDINDLIAKYQAKEVHDHIKELLDLEKQGRLIKLPCKPYTKVYEICTEFKDDKAFKIIEEQLLMRFGKNQYFEYAIFKREDGEDCVTLEQFGKTVFLTQEEAEKALEGTV